MVGHGREDSLLLMPQVEVAPRLAHDGETELGRGLNDLPRGEDGKPWQESDLDLNNPGAPTFRTELQEDLVVSSKPLHQVSDRLLARLPLVRHMSDEVGGHVPLPLLLHVDNRLHRGLDWLPAIKGLADRLSCGARGPRPSLGADRGFDLASCVDGLSLRPR